MALETELQWTLPEALQELAISGEQEIVVEVLSLFQSDTSARLRSLREAAQRGDRRRVQAQAHSLKGSAVQVGAIGFADCCREMEMTAESRPDLMSLVEEIETRFANVSRVMALEFRMVA